MVERALEPEFRGARRRLVEELRTNGIRDLAVLRAVEMTPRHLFVRRYRDVASFNRIPFAQSHETGIAKRFHERLEDIIGEFADGARAVPLPPWNQSAEFVEMPDFPVL